MHARAINVQAQPGRLPELLELIRDSVGPTVKQLPGWKSVTLLADRDAERVLTVTTWDTEADARAVDGNDAARAQFARVMPLLAAPPALAIYEVIV